LGTHSPKLRFEGVNKQDRTLAKQSLAKCVPKGDLGNEWLIDQPFQMVNRSTISENARITLSRSERTTKPKSVGPD
jgi:hypothetical protein